MTALQDFINEHSIALRASLGFILHALSTLFVDTEYSVRKKLKEFLIELYEQITSEEMGPFLPTLLAYLSSALSHIQEDIRMDGLMFLESLLKRYQVLLKEYAPSVSLFFKKKIQNFFLKK